MSETAQATELGATVPARRETPRSPAKAGVPQGKADRHAKKSARRTNSRPAPESGEARQADPDKETLAGVLDRWREEARVSCEVFDTIREKPNRMLTILAGMGASRSYLTSASLRWVAENVGHTRDLPAWKGMGEGFGETAPDEGIEHDLLHCAPDWGRQLPMARYLATHAHHRFPPIVVAAWKSWVNDPVSHVWVDGIAMEDSVTGVALDSRRSYANLSCKTTQFYVLDGQHRLMAIQGLQELLKNRRLDGKSPEGEALANTGITLAEVLEERAPYQSPLHPPEGDAPELSSVMDELIGVEIVPAVIQGETFLAAVQRLRSILVHSNRAARPNPQETNAT